MNNLTQHYFSDKLEACSYADKGGYAVYAKEAIGKGELLAMWGGDIVNGKQLQAKSEEQRTHSIQVWDDLFQVSYRDGEEPAPADYFNHSCTPNAGLCSSISLEAMRDIGAGEEVCFDYAMSDSTDYDEFECACGTPLCRGWVRGNDWTRSELQERYKEYFSPYLKRRIKGNR